MADERDCEPTIESLREQVRRLSGLVNDARGERDQARAGLAAAREREARLREALGAIAATPRTHWVDGAVVDIAQAALAREDGDGR
jgi:hypothetical protein